MSAEQAAVSLAHASKARSRRTQVKAVMVPAAVIAVPDEVMGEKVSAVLVPIGGHELDVEPGSWRTSGTAWPTSRCRSSCPS
jgi:hypothetical protein